MLFLLFLKLAFENKTKVHYFKTNILWVLNYIDCLIYVKLVYNTIYVLIFAMYNILITRNESPSIA